MKRLPEPETPAAFLFITMFSAQTESARRRISCSLFSQPRQGSVMDWP